LSASPLNVFVLSKKVYGKRNSNGDQKASRDNYPPHSSSQTHVFGITDPCHVIFKFFYHSACSGEKLLMRHRQSIYILAGLQPKATQLGTFSGG